MINTRTLEERMEFLGGICDTILYRMIGRNLDTTRIAFIIYSIYLTSSSSELHL
jgi:hypothetical protein